MSRRAEKHRRATARRVASAIRQHAAEQSARAQSSTQAVVKKVKPDLVLELSDSSVTLSEREGDFVLSQWVDKYEKAGGLKKGDTVVLQSQPEQTWYTVTDVVSEQSTELMFEVPPGTVVLSGAKKVPSGYLKCNGAAVSKKKYPALFKAVGTKFGSAGSSKFKVPELTPTAPPAQIVKLSYLIKT